MSVALPLSPMPLPEGDKADTSQSPERHSREPLCQGICVSLIMTQFQRRSCLSCHSHAGLLISSSSSPSLFALLCFSEILIKGKDRHDECEVAPLTTEGNEQCVWAPLNLKGLTFSIENIKINMLFCFGTQRGSVQTNGPVYRSKGELY